jgi:CheY-like chemotaxis protein
VFSLYFPVSKSEYIRPVINAKTAIYKGSGTILVVDDEAMVRKFAQVALERYGYRVLLAEHGEEAVRVFQSKHKDISLILLDLTMPVMNGEQALEHFRRIAPGVPVILSSGFSQAAAAERFTGKGLTGFLGKPYTSDQLAAAIEAALGNLPMTNAMASD